jgi:phage recombination protein Bet
MSNELVKYATDHGEVTLSPDIVRQYLVPANTQVSDQEVMMFLKLCEYQKLNPFLREVYLVKYGSFPASMVTGKETFTKRAERHPKYAGKQAGITVIREDGIFERRIGSMLLTGERLVGGWAKVYLVDHVVPDEIEVSLNEYIGKKADGTPTGMWLSKPATMIRKVALVQALREAFPEEFEGLYSQEEINTIDVTTLPTAPVTPVYVQEVSHVPEPTAKPSAPPLPPSAAIPNATVPSSTSYASTPVSKSDPGSFIVPGSKKYPNMTLREIAQQPAGAGYIKYFAENAKDQAVKDIVNAYLNQAKTGAPIAKPVQKDIPDGQVPWDDNFIPPPNDSDLPFPL